MLALCLAVLAGLYWLRRPDPTARAALSARELATQVLGDHLGTEFPGRKLIVLSNPFAQEKGQSRDVYRFDAAGVQGLRRGLGARAKVQAVVAPALREEYRRDPASAPIDPSSTTPLSFLVSGAALDQVFVEHPGVDIAVSLIGLPIDVARSQCWQDPARPRFALLLPDLRVVGDRDEVVRAVKSGKLAAMVLNKPGAPAEDVTLGDDLRAEFDRRYLLVTAQNIDQVIEVYRNLF